MFCKTAVRKIFKKVVGLQPAHLFKKTTTRVQMFSCEVCQIFRATFLQNTLGTACAKIPFYFYVDLSHKMFTLNLAFFWSTLHI